MPNRFWVVVLIAVLICVGFPEWAHGQGSPDLVISQSPSGANQVVRSQNDTVRVVVKNVGTDSVTVPFDIRVYLSLDAVIDLSDRTVGTEALSGIIAPNDSVTVDIPVTVPALLTLGNYQWLAMVDVSGQVDEGDETNNASIGNVVEVVAPPADLQVLSGPLGATEVNLNGNYTISLDFQNSGAGPTQNPFVVVVYLSADSLLDSTDVEVGRSTVSDKIFENATRTLQISVSIPSAHPQGSYNWLAVADLGNSEAESNESNNLGVGNVTQVVEKLADLVVSSPPVGPNGVYRRGNYTVTTQIKNQGTGSNVIDFDVVVFLSEDLIVGNSDDVRVGDIAISSIIPVDSTRAVTVPVTIPALQAYRSYQWVAIVDDVGFVSELNEGNNALIGSAVSVVPSPPDLVLENLIVSTPVERSNVYPITLDVVNNGDGATVGAFQVALFVSVDDSIGNADDVRVGNSTVTTILNAGDRQGVSLSMTVPSDQAYGTMKLYAVVDVSGIEAEADESNNTLFGNVPIDVVPSPPDLLFVTDPSGEERVYRDVVDTVRVQIRNQGVGDATSSFDVYVYLSVDAIADSTDLQVGAVVVDQDINAGETLEVLVPVVIPNNQTLGTYRWWAKLDANRVINETDETNNERLGTGVTIVHLPSDLTIFDDITTPTQVARGGVYEVSVPVRNIGTGPAPSGFQVELYLSEDDRFDDSDVLAGGRKFSDSFASNTELTTLVSVSIPNDLPVASYRWVARVSVIGLQDESDLSNNVRVGNPVTFPVITIEPNAIDFGSVRVGESRSETFEILNGGTARLSFEIALDDPTITVKPQSVTDLPPGVPWMVSVTYSPVSGDSLNASLSIQSNDPQGIGDVNLQGKGAVPETDRVFIDFDGQDENQKKVTYNAFGQEIVSMAIFMNNVPPLHQGQVVVAFDTLLLAYEQGSWTPAGILSDVSGNEVSFLSDGRLSLTFESDTELSGGTGLLGHLSFRTKSGFVTDSNALVRVQSFGSQVATDSTMTTVQVQSEGRIVYDLACWADIHGDGAVELRDFLTFIRAFDRRESDEGWDTELEALPSPETPYNRFDANVDGVINLSDFLLFTQVFGQNCVR